MREDVVYMSSKDYNSLLSLASAHKYKPLIYELMETGDGTNSNPISSVFAEIILSCLHYNVDKRPDITDLSNKIKEIDDMHIDLLNSSKQKVMYSHSNSLQRELKGKVSTPAFKSNAPQSIRSLSSVTERDKEKAISYSFLDTPAVSQRSSLSKYIADERQDEYTNLNMSKP